MMRTVLSLQFIRQNPDVVRDSLARRGEAESIDRILEVDSERRQLLQEVENIRAKRKKVSKEIARMKEKPAELLDEMREEGDRIKSLDQEISRCPVEGPHKGNIPGQIAVDHQGQAKGHDGADRRGCHADP